jgi:hypothetical protein
MLLSDYVLDVEGVKPIALMDVAVFAALAGSSLDEAPRCSLHGLDRGWASNRRAFDLRMSINVPKET